MEGPSFDSQSKEQLVSAPEAVIAALGGKVVESTGICQLSRFS
jgi:hypothetical protein